MNAAAAAPTPTLTTAEKHKILVEWNATATAYPRHQCLHEWVAEQVTRTPDAVAVVFEGASLTYQELNQRANQLARHLQKLGVGPEQLVAISLNRSLEMVVGLLGILKAGGAYVPVDPEYPADRVAYMLKDSNAPVVLSDQATRSRLAFGDAKVLCLDSDWSQIAQEQTSSPATRVKPENLAYVIYTSGSTGLPKGVMNTHAGIVNRLLWAQNQFGLSTTDRVLQKTPFSFDISVWEFFWPLLVGARLVVAAPGGHRDPAYLQKVIRREAITALHFVPSMLRPFLREVEAANCASLRLVFCGGEAITPDLQEIFFSRFPGLPLHNLYGPTEAAVDVTHWICRPDSGLRTVPIGRPIANVQAYILDEARQPVPVGVAGELHIGGIALARGYLHRPELTAEKFIPHPFSDQPGARLYRTGDLTRYRPDGNIEFLGRMDHQVKVRGFRIELGEIESVLGQHPALSACAVIARADEQGDPRIEAFLVPRNAVVISAGALQAWLGKKLPDYMVPTVFGKLKQLPLTPNGKLDRKALPPVEGVRLPTGTEYVAPRNALERQLCKIWQEVLGVERVGLHDNFFELGGHSLRAMQVVTRVERALGGTLSLLDFFEKPTLAELVAQWSGPLPPEPSAEPESVRREVPPRFPTPSIALDAQRFISPPIDDEDLVPPASIQEGLLFLSECDPKSTAYHIPMVWRLTGMLQADLLARAFAELLRRHDSLRTAFPLRHGRRVQFVAPPGPFPLPVVDLAGLLQPETQARQLLAESLQVPFDLVAGPLIWAKLFRLAPQEYLLLVNVHHVVIDEWSQSIFCRELSQIYSALAAGDKLSLPPLPWQYADYTRWQQQWLQGAEFTRQANYWQRQLAHALPLALPTDFSRPPCMTCAGAQHSFVIPGDLAGKLAGLNQLAQVTPFMSLLAVFQVLLSRYSRQQDILVGVPVTNRQQVEWEGMIGFFVNTLVLRGDLSGDPSFREFLRRVRTVALAAYEHQELPFEELVKLLNPARDWSRNPVFQVLFTVQNAPTHPLQLTGLETRAEQTFPPTTRFDLELYLCQQGDGWSGAWVYNTDLFAPETIERMAAHYLVLLESLLSHPDQSVEQVEMLTTAERRPMAASATPDSVLAVAEKHKILVEWNATETNYPTHQCLHDLFVEQAERTPESMAVVFEGQSLTYRELDHRTNQLARHLQKLGVGPEALVVISLERSLEMVVGLLGILKAGGAYVPVDPNYPADRVRYMLKDSQAPVVLSCQDTRRQLDFGVARVLCLDSDWAQVAQESTAPTVSGTTPKNLAYVIYTSGSTGQPKGVMNTHAGIVNRLLWAQDKFGLSVADRVLQKTPFSFDISVWEFFWPLLAGARLVVAAPGGHRDPAYLQQVIQREAITTLHFVPSMLRAFLREIDAGSCPSLRLVGCGGEAITPDLQEMFFARFPGLLLHNLYGPTEAAVDVTHWACRPDSGLRIVPIGRPIANVQLYILNEARQPVPVGTTGELHIGGVALARGYLNRPELTAEKFIPHPFSDQPGARLYRTGDLARYLPDGNIEFLGRMDYQVKVRGFRIELGEIESMLGQHPDISACAVIARPDEQGDTRIEAFLVPRDSVVLSAGTLQAWLGKKLPDHMVPSVFVQLKQLPLTPNGKLDRKALSQEAGVRLPTGTEYVAPRNGLEQQLVNIWQEILKARVGLYDNFFELGGHSLLATRTVLKIGQDLDVHFPVRLLFEAPTVAQLAEKLDLMLWSTRAKHQAAEETDLEVIEI